MNREQKTVDWRKLAKTLTPRTQAFIDGKYQPSISGATFDCINPATGKSIAQVASCDSADVDVPSRARAALSTPATGRAAPRPRARR